MNYVCRTCLSPDIEEMESINSIKFINNENISISKMVALCVGLEISKYDNFTNVICKPCTDVLITAFNYRKSCWDAHMNLLRQASQQNNSMEKDPGVFKIINCTIEKVIISEDEISIENVSTAKSFAIDDSAPSVSEQLSDHTELILDEAFSRSKRYNCRKCKYSFMRRDKIIDHLRLAHDIILSIPNGYTCNICFKIFEAETTLRNHQRRSHNATSCVCDICGATLKNKTTFEQHMYTHTGEKPFKCKFCDYRSAHLGSITSHQRRRHTEGKPFVCHLCGKGFASSGTRSQHIAIHSKPKFECIVCQKKFTTRTQYKKHMAVHDASKHVPCDLCGKKFTKQSNLTLHRKTHTGEKNHTCKECGKGFLQRRSWRTHMKNHHNQTVV